MKIRAGFGETLRSMKFLNQKFVAGERNQGMDITWVTGRIGVPVDIGVPGAEWREHGDGGARWNLTRHRHANRV